MQKHNVVLEAVWTTFFVFLQRGNSYLNFTRVKGIQEKIQARAYPHQPYMFVFMHG